MPAARHILAPIGAPRVGRHIRFRNPITNRSAAYPGFRVVRPLHRLQHSARRSTRASESTWARKPDLHRTQRRQRAPRSPLLRLVSRQRFERRQEYPLRAASCLDRLQPALANPVIHRPPRHAEQRRGLVDEERSVHRRICRARGVPQLVSPKHAGFPRSVGYFAGSCFPAGSRYPGRRFFSSALCNSSVFTLM